MALDRSGLKGQREELGLGTPGSHWDPNSREASAGQASRKVALASGNWASLGQGATGVRLWGWNGGPGLGPRHFPRPHLSGPTDQRVFPAQPSPGLSGPPQEAACTSAFPGGLAAWLGVVTPRPGLWDSAAAPYSRSQTPGLVPLLGVTAGREKARLPKCEPLPWACAALARLP